MSMQKSISNPTCAELMIMAERELAAFMKAVTELCGQEQARLSAQYWLEELAAMERLPGPASRHWRRVTVAALARLSGGGTVGLRQQTPLFAFTNTKVLVNTIV